MSAHCRIEMLGGLRAYVGGRAITRFQTQKTGSLLAFLAMNPGRMHAREKLAELLWPGDDPVAIRNRLNQALSSLRRQLHPPGIEAGTTLQADHHTISVNADSVETDVHSFRRAVRPPVASEPAAKQIARLEEGVGLYKGDFLSGSYEEWVLNERLFLSEQYIEALDRLIRLYVETGVPGRAIELATKRLDADPLDESGHIRLMRLYMRLDRPRAAMRQFENLKRLLIADGGEPGELAESIAARARLAAADSVEEEESWDGVQTATPQESPRERIALAPTPFNSIAPRFFTRFVGRESELERLDQWLLHGMSLATIVGPGGCGKTRLAAEFAASIEGRRDVVWVSLVDVAGANQIVTEIAVAAGADRFAIVDPLEAVRAQLGPMREPILILDNLEHLVDSAEFDLMPLWQARRDIRVLTTSRRPIGFGGELVMTMGPLPVPRLDSPSSILELAANPSVDLFVSRAQSVKQDFQLTERTADAISRLCIHLEGLPLAIELAASWARSLSPSQMLDEVTKRLDFLATKRRDISERHRSMRAAIDSSFELLTEDLKDFFTRLSVFVGGWDRNAARALAQDLDVDEALDELAARSLILTKPDGDSVRFSMLELLRAYASGKAAPDLRREIEWLHANYFLEFVVESERMSGGEGARRVDGELPNVLAALRRYMQSDEWGLALRLAETLGGYFEYRDQLREGLEWLIEVERNATDQDPVQLALLRRRIATLSWNHCDFDRVETMLNAAIPVLQDAGEVGHLIDALLLRRIQAHHDKQFFAAIASAHEIYDLAGSVGDRRNQSNALRQMGNSLLEIGKCDEALERFRQALEIGRELECPDLVGFALLNMGFLAIRMEMYGAAEAWLDEAGSIFVQSGRHAHAFDVMISQLQLARIRGDGTAASALVRRLGQCNVQMWHVLWEAYSTIGQYLVGAGALEAAAKSLGFASAVKHRAFGGASPLLSSELEAAIAETKSKLGPGFDEAFELGRSMSLNQIQRVVLELPIETAV